MFVIYVSTLLTGIGRYREQSCRVCPLCKLRFDVRRVPGECVTTLTSAPSINVVAYQLDSLKSRLQTTKTPITVPRLAALVYREEGIIGFYRGLWIPLTTISFVRKCPHVRFLPDDIFKPKLQGAASFTIYNRTKEQFRNHNYLNRYNILDVALVGGISGAMSGALISFGSARKFSFTFTELLLINGNSV